ncbi:MAG TPA: DMT family transporter [Desulfuromonadales bacterium]|nr:DMT family transporter [Desulfuromonadales bacterium]
MSNALLFLFVACAGAMVAIQPSVNAHLAEKIGVVEAACVSFSVGALSLAFLSLCVGNGSWRGLGTTVWWEWTGGLMGACFVSAMILAVPRIGTAAALATVIAVQLITGLALDAYGFFGFRSVPLDWRRGLGCLLLIAGAALVSRR